MFIDRFSFAFSLQIYYSWYKFYLWCFLVHLLVFSQGVRYYSHVCLYARKYEAAARRRFA